MRFIRYYDFRFTRLVRNIYFYFLTLSLHWTGNLSWFRLFFPLRRFDRGGFVVVIIVGGGGQNYIFICFNFFFPSTSISTDGGRQNKLFSSWHVFGWPLCFLIYQRQSRLVDRLNDLKKKKWKLHAFSLSSLTRDREEGEYYNVVLTHKVGW